MATIAVKPGSGAYNGHFVRLYVRLQMPSIWDGYALRLYNNTSGTDTVYLERFDGGAAATIATFPLEVFPGDRLRIRAIGPTIEAWYSSGSGAWTQLGTATDSTYLGVGYVAIGIRGTTARLDDFGAASLREPIPDTTEPIDDFNRADEQPLSDGGAWSQLNGYQLKVVSNQLACSQSGSTCQSWRTDVRYGVDQEAWATIETKQEYASYDAAWIRLYVRLQRPSMFEGYALRYNNWNGPDQILLERFDGGTPTVLASFNQEILQGDKLKIRAVGSTIEAWRHDNNLGAWVKLGEAVDSRYLGVGYVGVGIRRTSARLDDFGAVTLREPIPDTTVPIDDFNRADEQPLSDSGAWSQLNGYQLKVASNQLACSEPGATCQAWRSDASYGSDQEVWATMETEQEYSDYDAAWVRLYVRLQKPAEFDGYALRFNNRPGVDELLIERFDNGAPTVLTTLSQEVVIGDKLRLRAIGSTIEAWHRGSGSGTWVKLGQAADSTYVASGYLGVGIRRTTGRLDDFGGGNAIANLEPNALLARYVPQLRYDVLDTFRADSASMMTNNDPPGEGSGNFLWRDGEAIAWSEPTVSLDVLDLEYLGLSYPPGGVAQGRPATEYDYINAENSYSDDANRMQLAPGKTYGRVVAESNGQWTLQYWFFYYFNWHPELTNLGDHEGDWEMVQVELDSLGVPTGATASQHGGGEHCPWSSVERTSSGNPVVYVARGSHASYFRSGFKPGSEIDNVVGDYVDGNDTPVTPAVEEINPPAPAWLDWPGKWGASTEGSFQSPRGPAGQGQKWLFPLTWAAERRSCWEVSSSRRITTDAQPAGPPAPKLVATRLGDRVRIAYTFPSWPTGADRRPVILVASVKSSDPRYSPLMRRHRITTRKGIVRQPIGRGKGPYKVYAAAYSRSGRSSPTVVTRVRVP